MGHIFKKKKPRSKHIVKKKKNCFLNELIFVIIKTTKRWKFINRFIKRLNPVDWRNYNEAPQIEIVHLAHVHVSSSKKKEKKKFSTTYITFILSTLSFCFRRSCCLFFLLSLFASTYSIHSFFVSILSSTFNFYTESYNF